MALALLAHRDGGFDQIPREVVLEERNVAVAPPRAFQEFPARKRRIEP
jgi:hypothetical protein